MLDTDLNDLAKQLGGKILTQLKTDAKDAWDNAPDEGKAILERAAIRMGKLTLKKAAGEDVTQGMADVEAQLANCTWVGSSLVVRQFWSTVAHVATQVAQVVGAGLGAAAAGALGRLPGI